MSTLVGVSKRLVSRCASAIREKSTNDIRKGQPALQLSLRRFWAKTVISMCVDGKGIRFVSTRGGEVREWGILQLQPGEVENGVVTNPDGLAKRVSAQFGRRSLQASNVVVGLSGLHSVSRVLTLPLVPPKLRAEAIANEARREFPVPLDSFYCSWKIVERTRDEMRVLFVACPHDIIDSQVSALRKAGVRHCSMELSPLALANVSGKPTAAVFDVRAGEMDIVIMINNTPETIRSLPFPSELSAQEKLSIVKEELERTIRFYKSQRSVSNLPICGSGDLSRESREMLSKELGQDVTITAPQVTAGTETLPGSHLINIGLAMRGMRIHRTDGFRPLRLDIMPSAYRPRSYLPMVLALAALTVAAAAAGISAIQIENAATAAANIRAQLASVDKTLMQTHADLAGPRKTLASLQDKLGKANQKWTALSGAYNKFTVLHDNLTGDIDMAFWTLPDGVFVTGATMGADLEMDGKTSDEGKLMSYVQSLEASGRFLEVAIANVRIDPNTIDPANPLSFTLVLKRGD